MQEIVDQRINRNQVHADFQPPRANVSGADQNAGQGHGQDLVRNAVDVAQRLDQADARLRQRVRSAGILVPPGRGGDRSTRPGRLRQRRE